MRRIVQSKSALREIRAANPTWFARGNKRFFGDLAYFAYYGQTSGKPFLVRRTNTWTDMFGGPLRPHYRINPIGEDLKIKVWIDTEFPNLAAVRAWLREN